MAGVVVDRRGAGGQQRQAAAPAQRHRGVAQIAGHLPVIDPAEQGEQLVAAAAVAGGEHGGEVPDRDQAALADAGQHAGRLGLSAVGPGQQRRGGDLVDRLGEGVEGADGLGLAAGGWADQHAPQRVAVQRGRGRDRQGEPDMAGVVQVDVAGQQLQQFGDRARPARRRRSSRVPVGVDGGRPGRRGDRRRQRGPGGWLAVRRLRPSSHPGGGVGAAGGVTGLADMGMGGAQFGQQPGHVSGDVGALGLAAFLGRPMRQRQRQDLTVLQAPFDRGRDQAGQLPGAIAGGLREFAGQMRRKPLRQHRGVQRQRRLRPAGHGWVGRQQPVQGSVAAAGHSHRTKLERPPAARGLWL